MLKGYHFHKLNKELIQRLNSWDSDPSIQSNLSPHHRFYAFANDTSKGLYPLLQHLNIKLTPLSELHIQTNHPLWRSLKPHHILVLYSTPTQLGIVIDNPFNPIIALLEQEKKIGCWVITPMEMSAILTNNRKPKPTNIPLLSTLFKHAIEQDASDIHLYQEQHQLYIKFRVHGTLQPHTTVNKNEAHTLINLLKFHTHMDTGRHHLPQDGHLHIHHLSHTTDIRVASLPTKFGEDFVCRLLPKLPPKTLQDIGLPPRILQKVSTLLNKPSGLFLVTGPTGSGKTTTLYTCLQTIQQQSSCNIISLEDPIEQTLDGIRQSQINPQIGYTYAKGLKHCLRQDPDVILVGEIRDKQTAEIALEAAYTGHLVLSSLHTENAIEALMRLKAFHCDPTLIQHALAGILAQKLGTNPCKQGSKGCPKCHYTGHHKRLLKAEFLDWEACNKKGVQLTNLPLLHKLPTIKS